jgi:hypothetical protein
MLKNYTWAEACFNGASLIKQHGEINLEALHQQDITFLNAHNLLHSRKARSRGPGALRLQSA